MCTYIKCIKIAFSDFGPDYGEESIWDYSPGIDANFWESTKNIIMVSTINSILLHYEKAKYKFLCKILFCFQMLYFLLTILKVKLLN